MSEDAYAELSDTAFRKAVSLLAASGQDDQHSNEWEHLEFVMKTGQKAVAKREWLGERKSEDIRSCRYGLDLKRED